MRRVVSLVLLLTFAIVSVTGLTMGLSGGRGHEPGHRNMGPGADGRASTVSAEMVRLEPPLFPKELHEMAAYAMVAAGCVHLTLNVRVMAGYLGIGKPR